MPVPKLRWEPTVFQDPLGGEITLWPYLPCVLMPKQMRPRHWDGLALLSSIDELTSLREEEDQEKASPGVHLQSAVASGTSLGMLVRDLSALEIDGPSIPDPERIRLIRHAENSRGGMPVYPLEPGIDDEDWADWQSRWADEQVRLGNLIATMGRSRRWAKIRRKAASSVSKSKWVDANLGAASAVCAAWWMEESLSLTEKLVRERDSRLSARLRGALADLRGTDNKFSKNETTTLLVPVQQAYLPSLENSLFACEDVEMLRRE
ncbi:MAG: hypothetical protein CMB67_03865 [Euryarchaeota archaeon]|nr:hypothetical protein [Euryarchaeota archaeon]